ncbi:trichohyalin [Drosophila innubila]|uniref:trichohyalin n=1 Tax=Drosophila innubila TaxID=198719 RepID=UPI00148E251C|nr:trichohyalin [Drosophila innubila]
MVPSECSCQPDMKAFESSSDSESNSTVMVKDGKLSSDGFEEDQTSGKVDESQVQSSEQNNDDSPNVPQKIHSLPIIEEDQTSEKKKENRSKEREVRQLVVEERLTLINEDQTSGKKEESRLREREDRPLVLEARHSLSIAETKKRRASVYCDGNLFIPKELARSEVHQRRYSSAVNTLDQISSNRDYCIRMLKFPVGLGRARYVAQQLRRKKSKERKLRTEIELERHVDTSETELGIKEEPISIPNITPEQSDTNQLYSDDECCIVLEEIVEANASETEDDGTDELIDRLSQQQLKKASSLELRRPKDNELLADIQAEQHLPMFRWHFPVCDGSSIKMGLMEDSHNMNAEICVGFSEVDATATVAAAEQQESVEEQQRQQHVAAVPNRMPTATSCSQSFEPQVENLALRQHLMHRIILPRIHTEEFPQSTRVNNNTISLLNQNLQQHYVESLLPSELLQQYEKYAFIQTAPQEQQQSHTLRQQQSDSLWQQQQYQTAYQEQQHLEARREELQQLNAHYQRLKCQEDEQLRSLNKTLKDVYADRLLSERQHADYHRMFMHKMVESKKQEEHLQSQKEHIKRQLKAELGNLEQRIAEKRLQLQERNRAWQCQQHQYHQQQRHHQQQQHQQQQQHSTTATTAESSQDTCHSHKRHESCYTTLCTEGDDKNLI